MSTLPESESKAVDLLKETGEKGILQSEMWKALGIDSREGSRLAIRLEKKGLVKRVEAVHLGRKTFRVTYVAPEKPRVSLSSVYGTPCFPCPDIDRCGRGQTISPPSCERMTLWLSRVSRDDGRKIDDDQAIE